MDGRLKLYHNPRSRAAIARWMLEEVGAEYDLVQVDFEAGDSAKPEFLALNPLGKIPVLVLADGTAVSETPAILAYLADLYPDAGLAPAIGSSERGSYYRWLFFGGSCFEPALAMELMIKTSEPLPVRSLGWSSFDRVIDTLETTLSQRDVLVGSHVTAADVYIGAQLNWARMFGAPRIADSAVISAYLERLTARPAYQRAMSG
ncbi:glutathione S-transferase [Fulvimarina manganoxydans]|uniref:Glutathione S-transferase n=1 Tax=Fulvimarina manganoxydans TaxID=937218 RepID=A0A1W2DN63_9HYPH|nr:glutathione S-transferase [Fulvimarina manganoxydans]